MKFSLAVLIAMPAIAAAFAPSQPRVFITSLNAGGAAATKEEDLDLTRKVIAQFIDGDQEEPTAPPATEEEEE
eukprot:CAMPEP_0116998492 /NCGR_PEP_ID=MMETSP0472-20121206/1545_1 /TAXON_ID=693140 ORGANISM="Tiarina fusus, Strain LIS" /NCGR_SAMPLE_ID=MMETSP0472 /ASSEMBLY_ACC=CAM_ASM_000603 /LENGTH=72 /DNA_ID=CAMNT_0004697661 /DNA_START=97 /DNA_END=315 /DNA_ORIENTATION=-